MTRTGAPSRRAWSALAQTVVAAACLSACLWGSAQEGEGERGWHWRTIDTAAGVRSVLVYVPAGVPVAGAPATGAGPAGAGGAGPGAPALLFVLHGQGGTGAGIAEASGFEALADREGFVVAYPDALHGAWNYVRGIPGYPEAHDDTAFLTEAAARIEAEFGTDPARRYLVGYSNGGFMAQRVACDAPGTFGGVVAVAAGGFAGLDLVCPEGVAATIAFVHGTADANVPWDGLRVERGERAVYVTWPLPTTYAWWAQRAGCAPPATRTELAGNPADGVEGVTVLALEDCAAARRVALFGVRGGGHGWPSGAGFDASLAAWAFLRDQPEP